MTDRRIRRPWQFARNAFGPVVVGWAIDLMGVYYGSWPKLVSPGWGFAVAIAIDGTYAGLMLASRWEQRNRAVQAAPLWPLKAPNPELGQCPVCGMEDLDNLLDAQPYGSHRAHRDCAELVPFAGPKSERLPVGVAGYASGHGAVSSLVDRFPDALVRPVHLDRGSCTCFECEREIDRQRAKQARRLRIEPRQPDWSGLHGRDVMWTCRFCGLRRWAPGTVYAKNQLVEHARYDCRAHRQLGGKYGSRAVDVVLDPAWVGDTQDATVRIGREPPEGWMPFAIVRHDYDPGCWADAPSDFDRSQIEVTPALMPYAAWVREGVVVLFVEPHNGTVTEAAEARMLVTTTGGGVQSWSHLHVTTPIRRKHLAGTRLLMQP